MLSREEIRLSHEEMRLSRGEKRLSRGEARLLRGEMGGGGRGNFNFEVLTGGLSRGSSGMGDPESR